MESPVVTTFKINLEFFITFDLGRQDAMPRYDVTLLMLMFDGNRSVLARCEIFRVICIYL